MHVETEALIFSAFILSFLNMTLALCEESIFGFAIEKQWN
jgi:hypothetical protein